VKAWLVKSGVLAAAGVVLAGCWHPPAPPGPITLDTTGVRPDANYGELAQVLADAVDSRGLIDTVILGNRTALLDAQLKRLAVTGPTVTPALFPTPEDRLAYWYNARAGWSLKMLAMSPCTKDSPCPEAEDRRFPLDGRTMTLADIDAVLADDADWRTLVCAPGCCLSRARPPAKPLSGADIRRRIAQGFIELVDDPARFVIDVESQQILVPSVLWRYRQRLIDHYQNTYGTVGATLGTALLPYLSGSALRRLQDAIGYQTVELSAGDKPAISD
jgi:hypothetical protein